MTSNGVDPNVLQLANGLNDALLPAISECDQSMRGVSISQLVLTAQLDKLTAGSANMSCLDCCRVMSSAMFVFLSHRIGEVY